MLIIENTTKFRLGGPAAVAIGKFDGVHLGHRKLLGRIIKQKENGYLATVFTFDTPAAAFFGGDDKELTTREEKRAIFKEMGIDVLIEFPLNMETAATEPEEFVTRYLTQQMRAAYICAGTDLSFGRRGAGNYELLQAYAGRCGYSLEIIDKVRVEGEEVSSTRVRELVKNGQMEKAAAMLGEYYSLEGVVEHGRNFGHTIGMPTANLIPVKDKLLPPDGVYYSEVLCEGTQYRAITNIGYKPTVTNEHKIGVESFLYDFTGDLYGKDIKVSLLSFCRPERRFAGVEALKKQVEADIAGGKCFFG